MGGTTVVALEQKDGSGSDAGKYLPCGYAIVHYLQLQQQGWFRLRGDHTLCLGLVDLHRWKGAVPPLMPSLRVCCPVIGRQRHSPNVSWLIKFDPAVPRILGIDIHNLSRGTLIRQVDVN